jgi:hypothetical protein
MNMGIGNRILPDGKQKFLTTLIPPLTQRDGVFYQELRNSILFLWEFSW